MQKIYENLKNYEQTQSDSIRQDLMNLIEEQNLLIQHEHPVQKRKIQSELNVIRDRIAIVYNNQKQKIAKEKDLKNREKLFNSDHSSIQMEQLQMDYANTQVDQMINQGKQYINEISNQNQMMKRMKNKLLTSLSTLGVSQSLIAKINTRLSSDIWLFWGLVLGFFVIVYLFIVYVI